MPDYQADLDIRQLFETRLRMPEESDAAERERLQEFLRRDQVLEQFYRSHPPEQRPPEPDLQGAADSAMAAYDQRSAHLSVGWQKFLVLQAGIAGAPDNLDSASIQEWAYARIHEENPHWLGDFDEDIDTNQPMRWLSQTIGFAVLSARRRTTAAPPPSQSKAAAGGGCALTILPILGVLAAVGIGFTSF